MRASLVSLIVAAGVALAPVAAAAQAEKSLEKCQKIVGKEIGKYVATKQKTIAKCLDKIAAERIKDAASDAAGAAKSCASGLRKIVNTENPTKELDDKLRAKIEKSCLAAGLEHDEGDVLGDGSGVAGDQINASPQMAIPCLHFGGDGIFETADEWVSCLIAMADAQAIRQVHLEYPNADAWLREVRPDILALGGDQKYVDAANALDTVRRWVANGDSTVTDYVTGLMWEKKDDSGGFRDKDNTYTWSAGGSEADGTLFTNFLTLLNGATGGYPTCVSSNAVTQTSLTGGTKYCDWRLPTIAELKTIMLEPYPCGTSPCIDVDVFGPTQPSYYWSATTAAGVTPSAWYVLFNSGIALYDAKTNGYFVRAVRGGS